MKLDRVLVSSDDNPLYLDFWPVISKVWREKIGIEPVLLHICDEDRDLYSDHYGSVIKIKRVEEVDTGFQAQIVRLFGPVFFPDQVCLISDIDMIPLSSDYFTKSIEKVMDTSFVIYSSDAYHTRNRYPMCYNAALGKVFADILEIDGNYPTFVNRLKSLGLGWDTDEYYLGQCINKCGYSNIVKLKRGWPGNIASRRIDRIQWTYDEIAVKGGNYIDCHSLRPLSEYQGEVMKLINLIP